MTHRSCVATASLYMCLLIIHFLAFSSAKNSIQNAISEQQQQENDKASPHIQHRRRLVDSGAFHDRVTNDKFINETLKEHLPMFEPVDFQFVSPTSFPNPIERVANGRKMAPYLKPSFGGTHRRDRDAIFVFAAEYGIDVYLLFLSTLRATGYDGDVVVALSPLDAQDKEIKEYLESDPHVIVYTIDITCFNAENQPVPSTKGGIRVCKCDNLYGEYEMNDDAPDEAHRHFESMPDPRSARPVATTRYEIYWVWIQHYSSHSWILLTDVRDAVFQSNPFLQVPREANKEREDGLLIFFGENPEATRLGKSPKNRKWLKNAYGEMVKETLKNKPTVCSGTTLGEVIALETYLRAMVGEADETQVKMMGADQGFHNYLYYSQKLAAARTIRQILVQDQGSAIVNTLGAMRTKPLDKWGNGNLINATKDKDGRVVDLKVLNWNGEPSPLVHQFDRHELLTDYWYNYKTQEYQEAWQKKKQELEKQRAPRENGSAA